MKRITLLLCLLMTLCCVVEKVDAKEKKYKNGDFYSGEWKKGKPDGNGKMVFSNGLIYEGLWQDGKIVGDGTIESEVGKFKGNFTPIYDNGILSSFKPVKGTLNTQDTEMDGEWNDNNIFKGTLTHPDFVFKGVIDGTTYKEGRIDLKDGGFIEGTMLMTPQFEGKIDKVVLTESSFLDRPAIYYGVFKDRKFIGHVKGSKYNDQIDEFDVEVKEDGSQYGTFTLKKGGKYKGLIKNKKYNGEGLLTKKTGNYSGNWTDGKLIDGDIKEWDSYGNTYYFTVSEGVTTYNFSDGEVFTISEKVDDDSVLYPKIVKYLADKAEMQRQEAIKRQVEEERLAREKVAKEWNSKYSGMVFQGEGSLFALLDDDATGFLGLLLGAKMTQTLRVTFLPDGQVNVREIDTNVSSSSSNRMSDTQWLAMAMNSSGGKTYNASVQGNKIILSPNVYIIISKDKRSLKIYGLSASYTLKRKLK